MSCLILFANSFANISGAMATEALLKHNSQVVRVHFSKKEGKSPSDAISICSSCGSIHSDAILQDLGDKDVEVRIKNASRPSSASPPCSPLSILSACSPSMPRSPSETSRKKKRRRLKKMTRFDSASPLSTSISLASGQQPTQKKKSLVPIVSASSSASGSSAPRDSDASWAPASSTSDSSRASSTRPSSTKDDKTTEENNDEMETAVITSQTKKRGKAKKKKQNNKKKASKVMARTAKIKRNDKNRELYRNDSKLRKILQQKSLEQYYKCKEKTPIDEWRKKQTEKRRISQVYTKVRQKLPADEQQDHKEVRRIRRFIHIRFTSE